MRDFLCLSSLVDNSGNDLRLILKGLGVNRKTWNDWLWGISEPSKEQIDLMAKFLNCSTVVIDVAIAQNRASWERRQQRMAINNTRKNEDGSARGVFAERLVQVVVSVVTSVTTTLILLGKI